MARARMIVLYDQSEAFKGLVIGTSNKTELLLGYGTLYGDMASALNPIGDLYKSQLRQVAVDLGVPERIIAKPPTADLWPGQTDAAELGFDEVQFDYVRCPDKKGVVFSHPSNQDSRTEAVMRGVSLGLISQNTANIAEE